MKRIIKITVAAWMLVMIASCSEFTFVQPPVDNVPPPSLNNVQVESLPGGAKITYEVPSTDRDISYVKAEYLFQAKKKTVRSSIYNDFLTIEGLGSVEPVEVTLYLVDHSENHSTPVTKSFVPDVPPLQTIFESVEMMADFGGLAITWQNVTGIEIGITIFAEDTAKVLKETVTAYSQQKDGSYFLRGREPLEQRFAVCFADKWGNISDTMEIKTTPLFEKKLQKSKFRQAILPGDDISNYLNQNRQMIYHLWDNNLETLWHTEMGRAYPLYITIDLGVIANISRMHLWGRRGTEFYFAHFSFKTFEVWGAEKYNQDSSVEYWTNDDGWKADGDWSLLGDYVIVKPSGYPSGTLSDEDREFWEAGFQYNIPVDFPPCRYLRFVVKSVWSPGGVNMAEFDFYGNDGSDEID
jgi:hypothetical protein